MQLVYWSLQSAERHFAHLDAENGSVRETAKEPNGSVARKALCKQMEDMMKLIDALKSQMKMKDMDKESKTLNFSTAICI